jgi:hypothetical protein
MEKVQVFLLIAGLCWAALLLNMLGTFLKRFAAVRKFGTVLQWQAFAFYLLGLAGTAALIWPTQHGDGWHYILIFVGVFTFVPLGACTFQFYKAVKASRNKTT